MRGLLNGKRRGWVFGFHRQKKQERSWGLCVCVCVCVCVLTEHHHEETERGKIDDFVHNAKNLFFFSFSDLAKAKIRNVYLLLINWLVTQATNWLVSFEHFVWHIPNINISCHSNDISISKTSEIRELLTVIVERDDENCWTHRCNISIRGITVFTHSFGWCVKHTLACSFTIQ